MDAEFSSEAQPMQQQMQPQMQQMSFGEEAPDESDSAVEDVANPVIFARLESAVNSVAFSPDGRKIIAGLGNGTLQLFEAISGKPIGKPFQGHENEVRSVAFSPDGKVIVSGSWDKTLRLWNLQGNQIGNPFRGHEDRVGSVAFSPDGKAIISGSWDETLRLWDLQGNQIGNPFQQFDTLQRLVSAAVNSVAFSPDGKAIISGSGMLISGRIRSFENTLRLRDLQGNQIGNPFRGHRNSVNSVAFSPDGKAIVSGSFDNTIRLWTLEGNPILNLADRRRQIEIPQGVANDSAQGEDCLNVQDEIEAMATVLMLRSLQPPMAVAILGSWGSGKSFGMHLIQQRIEEIRRQELTRLQAWGDPNFPNDTQIVSPYVGHIYQISFNAWTYAKSDLWASLMQEIFYELNRQITLERQIGIFLSASLAPQTNASNSLSKSSSTRNIDRLIGKMGLKPRRSRAGLFQERERESLSE